MKGIYKITSPSNKVYIGQSHDIKQRICHYKSGRTEKQKKLHSSMLKYGFDAHKFDIVHELPNDVEQNVLDTYEQLYMDLYRQAGVELLNIKMAGSRGRISEETKIKIGIASRGKKLSDETKRKISIANTGKTRSIETRNKISSIQKELAEKTSQRMKGRNLSEETREKISLFQLGGKRPCNAGENNNMAKLNREQVLSIKDGYSGGSIMKYAREIGKSYSTVYRIIENKNWKHLW